MGSCSIVATEKKGIVVPQTFCHVVCTVNRYLWCLGVSLRSHHRCSRNLHLLQFILSRRDQFMGIFWKSKISINSLSACLYFSLYLFEMLEAFLNHLAAEFLHGRVHIVLFELRYQASYGRLNPDHHSRDHLLLAPQQYDFCFPETGSSLSPLPVGPFGYQDESQPRMSHLPSLVYEYVSMILMKMPII